MELLISLLVLLGYVAAYIASFFIFVTLVTVAMVFSFKWVSFLVNKLL
jgi:uncharacterized membrane protein YphA (DoxX/SURF4 family)